VPGSGTGISGGVVNVLSGGSADHVGVSSGGTFNVAAGGTGARLYRIEWRYGECVRHHHRQCQRGRGAGP